MILFIRQIFIGCFIFGSVKLRLILVSKHRALIGIVGLNVPFIAKQVFADQNLKTLC